MKKTLSNLETGQTHCIIDMDLEPKLRKRLYELGLHTRAQVTMKKNDKGPCVVLVHHSNIALSRDLCEKIYVDCDKRGEYCIE